MFAKAKYVVRGRSGIFVKVMACLLLIILAPTVVMGFVWHKNIKEKNHADMMEKERRSLQEVQEFYGQIVTYVEQDLLDTLYGTGFKNYIATGKPEYMVQVMQEVAKTSNWNESLYSVYLYDTREEKIWDSASRQWNLEDFYDTGWLEQRARHVSLQHLPIRQNVDELFYERALLEGTARLYPVKNVLTIITPQLMEAMLVGNIDMEALGRELKERFAFSGKQVCLFEGEDALYNSLVGEELCIKDLPWKAGNGFFEARGGDRYYFACLLDGTELYYMESVPLEDFYSSSIGYGSYIARVACIVLAVMVALALLMAMRLYRPLDELYSVVSVYQRKSGATELNEEAERQAVKRAFSYMKNGEKTETDMRITEAFVSAAQLRMLLDGIITQENFFLENAVAFGRSEKRQCSLLLCRLRENLSGEEREKRNRRLQETLDVYLMARLEGILSETSGGEFAVLFSGNTEEELARTRQFLVKIFNELTGDDNFFAASGVFSREESIRERYRECRITLENEIFFEGWESAGEPVYPLSEENYNYKSLLSYAPSMIRAIVTGEAEELAKKLEGLREEILSVGRKDYAQNLCARILGEIDKELVLEPLKSYQGDLLREVYGISSLDDLMTYMREILLKRLESMNNQESHQREKKYYQDAIAYIQENYQKNINITEVAEAIGISYVYLNKIFKAQHEQEEKLIDYLNRTRIGRATELLLETEDTLAVVAEKVGYNNVQSFTRVFKKYKGLAPGEWKRKCKGVS